MKSAAMELGQHNITVNAIIPGLVDTPLTRYEKRLSETIGETGRPPMENPTPEIGRLRSPREHANSQTGLRRMPHISLRFLGPGSCARSPKETLPAKKASPQAMVKGTTTRSPTFSLSTPLPTSTTSPIVSCPRTSPLCILGIMPL